MTPAPPRRCEYASSPTHFAEYGYALAQSLARSADVLVVASEENTKRTGQRCKLPSMLGGNVCRAHGGAAPQTRAKAQRRLQPAADVLVQRLLSFALDGNVPDAVALQAIRDALDRAGLKPGVEVGMTVKPYESILEQVESGSRAEFRRSRGVADDTEHPPALADTPRELTTADADAPIDAEIVDDGTELIAAMRRSGRVTDDGQPNHTRRDRTRLSAAHGGGNRPASGHHDA